MNVKIEQGSDFDIDNGIDYIHNDRCGDVIDSSHEPLRVLASSLVTANL